MHRRFRKTAAIVMAASLLLQCGINAGADEVQPQAETAAVTEAAPAETQAPTEVQTEAPQTQAATEAPQTQAPTEAPQTQAATEAPQTQAPTEAPQTQASTEAAKTETEKEKETKDEKAAETEAKRSDRENDGDKITADLLVSDLGKALDYVLIADTLEASKALLKNQEIVKGDDADVLLEKLQELSLTLANSCSSDDVEVFNLYADSDGTLDLAQLEAVYEDHVIDVTKKYIVVNVIADSPEQDLEFSGFDMIASGEAVTYKEETQPGDILYNFAAWQDDAIVDYEGSLTLTKSAGLQGTFLAPKAEVNVASSLAGAVFADTVKVADTVDHLLSIRLVDGWQAEDETETETEQLTEAAETETEQLTEAAESETEQLTEAAESETEQLTEAAEAETEQLTEAAEAETEQLTEAAESETEHLTEAPETELQTEPASGIALNEQEEGSAVDAETASVSLIVKAVDAEGNELADAIQKAVFAVKVRNEDGSTAYLTNEDGSVQTFAYSNADTPFQIEGLAFGIAYTLVQLSTDDGYQVADDIPFSIEDAASDPAKITVENQIAGGSNEITAHITPVYNNVTLTAAKDTDTGRYAALFMQQSDENADAAQGEEASESSAKRISSVYPLAYTAESSTVDVTFTGLDAGTYLLKEVDAQGEPMDADQAMIASQTITVADAAKDEPSDDSADQSADTDTAAGTEQEVNAQLTYPEGSYPEGEFYYTAKITVTKELKDADGNSMVGGTFSATLSSEDILEEQKADFSMNSASSVTRTVDVKVTAAEADIAVAETNANTSSFNYNVTYNPAGADLISAVVSVSCAASAGGSAVITNQMKSQDALETPVTLVTIAAAADGKNIADVSLVIKDKKGKIVLGPVASAAAPITVSSLTEGETYYLSEVTAPSGYAPAKDIKFTVESGKTTAVVLNHTKTAATDYQITATKQVYSGDYQVYASGTSTNHNFYVALFEDKDYLIKVSDVQTITVSGLSGSTVFKNLTSGSTYYIAETDANGEVKASTSTLKIQYENSGAVKIADKNNTTTIQNRYTSLPKGYRYTATLTITKKVTNASDEAEAVSETFYAGIFRNADYSGTPTIVKLELNNKSSVSVKRRILLTGTTEASYKDVTYYIAEVDSKGNLLTDSDYNISIDSEQVTLSKGDDKTVTITNQTKTNSKVTLYLTKRVYEGSSKKKVTETFYAGLFKDSSFTQLYTNPIPLTLKDKSEVTLKLTLNLGKTNNATIYVAEVDSKGNVITDQQGFGYEIKMVNSTAAFTKDVKEIRSVLLNSVYGTSTSDDWNDIVSANNQGLSDAVSENGEASAGTAAVAAETGDATPIGWYLILLLAAAAVFAGAVTGKKRNKLQM